MKTIQDLKSEHINKIYSIMMGRECTAGKIDWCDGHDFVVAVFKTEECTINDRYDTIEYGIMIGDDLEVKFTWWWINKIGTACEQRYLPNHHLVTKYMMEEGFDVFKLIKE